jgi:hypothetical protein
VIKKIAKLRVSLLFFALEMYEKKPVRVDKRNPIADIAPKCVVLSHASESEKFPARVSSSVIKYMIDTSVSVTPRKAIEVIVMNLKISSHLSVFSCAISSPH